MRRSIGNGHCHLLLTDTKSHYLLLYELVCSNAIQYTVSRHELCVLVSIAHSLNTI